MADVKWIKVVVDIFDDEKILLIESLPDADSIIVCWFKILCLAGKQNNSGVLMLNDRIPYTEEMLATIFRRPIQTVRLALDTFERFGMIEIVNGAVTIPNWGKHQSLERLEKLREYQREYHREYRKKQGQLSDGKHDDKLYVNGADIEKETDKDKKEKRNIFIAPTVEEVKAYCEERNNYIDPQKFIDYYTANGWKVGRNKMKDWRAAVRTWEKNESKKPEPKKKQYTTAEQYKAPKKAMTSEELRKLVDRI